MIGILVLLLISYSLLVILKKDKNALGIFISLSSSRWVIYSFFITAFIGIAYFIFKADIQDSNLLLQKTDLSTIFNASFWDLKSVIFEELLFRGVVLYLLIERLGKSKSILLMAVAFGIYHWFSYNILGQIVPMVAIFLGTGLMGYALGLAYAKTHTIWLPIAIHFGWNVINNTLFSKGPLGTMVYVEKGGKALSAFTETVVQFIIPMLLIPILLGLYVKFIVPEIHKKKLAYL